MEPGTIDRLFSRVAHWTAHQCGGATTFILAVAVIAVWAVTGPLFGFSDTWQLIINTGTTIVTFLMVFLIQNTQNRDTAALQLKLDELIRVNKSARNALMDLEDRSEAEIERVKADIADQCDDPAETKTTAAAAGAERQSRPKPRR